MKVLVTEGCGFLGSNIAAHALNQNFELTVFDNLSRVGSCQNLDGLYSLGGGKFFHSDIRNSNEVDRCLREHKPDVVLHLAGQVAMTTSITDPRKDFEINALGTFNLLEAIRRYTPHAAVIYSSTNKVYGDLENLDCQETAMRYICQGYPHGFDESLPLDFHSPYGCSKGAADQYLLDYARIFGLNTVVFRHSTIYGSRQFSTFDQGWIGWFCQKALEQAENLNALPFTIAGNGKQVRDVLHADDAVRCYFLVAEKINQIRGSVFNIGGGMSNSLSLLELFQLLETQLDIKLWYENKIWRETDQKIFVADISRIAKLMNWKPEISFKAGIERMLSWLTMTKL